MGTSIYEGGCSFSTFMGPSDRSGGFRICEFHANHPQVRSAKVCDLQAVIQSTTDEWRQWYMVEKAALSEYWEHAAAG